MADTPVVGTPSAGMKRSRDDEDEGDAFDYGSRYEKKARPGSGDSNSWPQDSVINTPTASFISRTYQKAKYDSDDQSSMVSEPGSPQDIAMSSGDEDMGDETATFSQSPEDAFISSSTGKLPTSPWFARMQQTNRVPTPIQPPSRPGIQPMQVRTGVRHHMRQRHPQENISSSDLLEVPSPIDEDEVPTPPSAAEAAGSQLSMLTVNDMDMEPAEALVPSISIDESRTPPFGEQMGVESAVDVEPMDDDYRDSRLIVRKQRQRSGALSSGQGSPSPVRAEPILATAKRGFSMGFRADCEKCRMRVPGHMNHFID